MTIILDPQNLKKCQQQIKAREKQSYNKTILTVYYKKKKKKRYKRVKAICQLPLISTQGGHLILPGNIYECAPMLQDYTDIYITDIPIDLYLVQKPT